MKLRLWFALLLIPLSVSCNSIAPSSTESSVSTESPTETVVLPTPFQKTTPVPDPSIAIRAYLEAWKVDDYAGMYAMLTDISQDAINEEDFTKFYRTVATEAALSGIDYEILSTLVNPRSAQASYRVVLHSVLVGDIQRDTVMNLSLEEGQWQIQWSEELILPEFKGGNYLWMDRHIPSRANIYDRNGNAITTYTTAVSVGIFPDSIDPEYENELLSEVKFITGLHPDAVRYKYLDYPAGAPWYLPLGEVLYEKLDGYYDLENGYNLNGLLMYPFEARVYLDNGVAPQSIGYVSLIQADEEEEFLRKGYSRDEKVGRQGIERWGEPYLGGTRGGTLYVIDSNDEVVTQLADVPAQPAQAIYTTLDKDLQLAVQNTLQTHAGAAVVIEVDTGRVLAMASSPHFDPNAFEPANTNSVYQLEEIYDPYGWQPLYNRATRGQYPLGSVFKIITFSAALESGLYTPQTEYQCGYDFTEIPSIAPRHDWTWEHFQNDGRTQPSGNVNLLEGLMVSCNPYFWHIGLDLYRQGLTDAVSEMARGFGLGSLTGIVGVEEEDGNIPDPGDEVAAINNAIGQGDTLVTPIQVARFIAAIGNGGTLYQPQIIERISPPDGEPTFEFEPVVYGELPISPETLEALRRAMTMVVESPRGTARWILGGFSQNSYSVSGKTGTAESGVGDSHAWFAGFTRENRENKPDIAVVVICEQAGEGSEIAAPIFRGIVQYYFEGRRTNPLPWESLVGVPELPQPEEDVVEGTP
jgi:cell division protein FtsI/penicillin-binding protein 2